MYLSTTNGPAKKSHQFPHSFIAGTEFESEILSTRKQVGRASVVYQGAALHLI
jgi:hypothetical protein